jgi:hypothetical protein
MAIVVLQKKPTKEDIKIAREEYSEYIKITADLLQKIVLIGGEYHADSEKILIEEYESKQKDIWGGGYNIILKKFETNAIINMRQPINDSTDILNPEIRDSFLKLVEEKLFDVESLL